MLGAAEDGLSWDCWKPVLHDTSLAPSSGMLLKEVEIHYTILLRTKNILFQVFADSRLKTVTQTDNKFVIQNIWEEEFDITFLDIPGHGIAAHATKL
jgi:hypothetical protein